MSLTNTVILYLLMIPVFFIIDILWLGVVAKQFYHRKLALLIREKFNWGAALSFYCIFIIGILIFAVLPAVEAQSWQKAILLGGLFGFFTYATYELTNLATLKHWSFKLVCVDITWGIILSGSVATAGFFIAKALHFV